MADELDDFTSQLNNTTEEKTAGGPETNIPGLPPGATPEQIAAIKAA